jgi:hypothetical protein
MKSSTFWKAVLVDRDNLLESFLQLLEDSHVRYCLIGGAAVNAYAEPVITQDLDVAVAADDIESLERTLSSRYTVKRFPHSINVSTAGTKLQIQIQTDPRYFPFVQRAELREVMDYKVLVARIEDVLQGKIWAALDSTRRPSKQLKDLSDIARLIEAEPQLEMHVPQEILSKIPKQK